MPTDHRYLLKGQKHTVAIAPGLKFHRIPKNTKKSRFFLSILAIVGIKIIKNVFSSHLTTPKSADTLVEGI